MTDFETAMLSFLQDAQNEFNSEKEVDYFIGKHAPKLMEAARKQLMAEIEAIPKVWHSIDEKADSSKFVVLYDVNGGYMSPPSRCMLGFDSMFINAMNKKHGANYTMWAYKDDLAPNKRED